MALGPAAIRRASSERESEEKSPRQPPSRGRVAGGIPSNVRPCELIRPVTSPVSRRTGATSPSRRYALGEAAAGTGTSVSRLSRASASRGTA